ncbi:MAG: M3 family oligoendopeptidase [Anaerolineales bacterium]|nr:M3 family oligoendopeptidase [Anaerolineales bacterium]
MATVKYKQEKWSLDNLYAGFDDPKVQKARDQVEECVKAFEEIRSRLSPDLSEADFLEVLKDYEELYRLISRLAYFGFLRFNEDTQDQSAQTFQAQMQQLAAEVDNRTLFFKLWWKGLEDEPAERLMKAPGDYRYWLEALRLQKPYTLSEPEEKVINLKDVNGPQALVTLYQSITNRYTYKFEVDGEVKEMTRGELQVYYRDPNPELRKAAYQELHRVHEQDEPILGQIYQYIVRDWRSEQINLRNYASPISVRNISNDVPDEIVDLLLEACQKNVSIFHRFFNLKARWIGIDRLRRYDIYAPVVKTETTYAFTDATNLVLGSLREFDPKVADLAQRVFDEHHLDGEVRQGKRDGAFCATVSPDLTPWVLQSYQGRPDDVATLAHEIGHAIHSMLAEHHTALTQEASLPLCETASTFSEMLLIDRMLAEDPDPEVQRDLLFRQMDDAYATIIRQGYFALFEREAHDAIHNGASVDGLSQVYFENIKRQFGESLDLTDDFSVEWAEIGHFYFAPFYVYAYAFGQLLVLSLYQQYLQEGESFKPRYLEILAAGGSDSPSRILERAGIDIRSADFWQGGFDVLKTALERLEAIEIVT